MKPESLIYAGIEANRRQAADLAGSLLAGDPEAAERMNMLNDAWFDLVQAGHELTGIDFAPYRMKRA